MSRLIAVGLRHRRKTETEGCRQPIRQELRALVGIRGTANGMHRYGSTESNNTCTQEMIFLRLAVDEDMQRIIMVIPPPEIMYNPRMLITQNHYDKRNYGLHRWIQYGILPY